MGSAAWLTDALATADAATEALGLVGTVTHEAWIGQDSGGDPIYATAVLRKARIQEGALPHRQGDTGDLVTTRACIQFIGAVEFNGAEGRREPIDPRDRITMPSGLTGPIEDIRDALVDPLTGRPIRHTVWLR